MSLKAVSLLLALPALANAYSWQFTSTPSQCKNVTIDITGSGGQPPYRVLGIPVAGTPFANGTEVRRIFEVPFDGDSTSISFKLNYPANSQFVAVVSDAAGFGTGGTSVAAQVTDSDDDSCFDASNGSVSPAFTYAVTPEYQIVQCVPTRIWWTEGAPEGDPVFLGVIPGGESFEIPQEEYSTVAEQGVGFSWTPNLRSMTQFTLVGGDSRGNGSAGSTLYTVAGGNDNSCLSDDSPSSTAGDPAGGAYQTGSDGTGVGGDDDSGNGGSGGGSSGGDSGGSSGGGGTNVGAIAGGVVGGVVGLIAIILLLWFLRRRSKQQHKLKEKHVDLLNEDEGDERPARQELPQYYEPEPFVVPDPTSDGTSTNGDNRYMSSRSETPDMLSSSSSAPGGKRAPKALRPVNIMQHEDAGPSVAPPQEEEEMIELPPAYTNIRKDGTPGTPNEAGPSV